MEKKKDISVINCIATSLLAYFITVPGHELLHLLTALAYGEKIIWYTAGAVLSSGTKSDYIQMAPFHRIMVAGGSASIINAIIAVILVFVLLKATLTPMWRLFLTQFMGAQMTQGIGYFMVGGIFGAGDWGSVFACFPDSPGAVAVMRVILSVLGVGGILFLMFFLNYLSYYFIEDPADKKQRMYVALRLHLVMFILTFLVSPLTMIKSPAITGGYMSFAFVFLFDLMWIPFFWAFMYTGILVRPPKKSRFLYPLPAKPNYVLLAVSVILILIDIFVFGPGIYFN